MPPRARPSTTADPSTDVRSNRHELPPYQTPSFPLQLTARTALANLAREYSTDRILKKLQLAGENIGESAGEINERLYELDRAHKTKQKRKAKQAADALRDGAEDMDTDVDADGDAQALEYLVQTRARIERMTAGLEKSTRRTIDGFAAVTALEDSLKHVSNVAVASVQVQSNATQATQLTMANTQSSMRGTAVTTTTMNMDSDDDGPNQDAPRASASATAATAAAPSPSALAPAFETSLQSRIDRYQATSHYVRYAQHNLYVNYKSLVYDAGDPEQRGPGLPHASKWFAPTEGGGGSAPQPGVTVTGGADGEDDSDDDIAIAGQKISTKCPITLLEFKDPVTSTKCPHSYERFAIEDMISKAPLPPPVRGRPAIPAGWRPTILCPVSGCDHIIGKNDIRPDPVLVRRIKRIQRARQMQAEEDEADGETNGRGVEEIESDSGDDVDAVQARFEIRGKTPAQIARVKREAASRRGTGRISTVDTIDD